MLERVWRKGSSLILLVGMKVGIAPMENSMEMPQKTKNRITVLSRNPLLSIYLDKTLVQKDTCTPMLIAVLFIIIAKTYTE